MLKINESRFLGFFEELKSFNDTPDNGYSRTVFSETELLTLRWFEDTLKSYELYDYTDSVKNVFGRYGDKEECILIGSHLDTVHNGGLYDGALGVLAGLEVLISLKEQNVDLPFSVQLVAFRGEEANILGGTFGSRAFTGKVDFTDKFNMDIKSTDLTVEDVKNAYNNDSYKQYLELHIEQGSVLEDTETEIGIVTAIAGLRRLFVKVPGKSGHAGTTPMHSRNDALKKATGLLYDIYQFSETLDKESVLTIGELNIAPNQANVIPNEVNFLVEVRSSTDEKLDAYMNRLSELISYDKEVVIQKPANTLDANVIETLEKTTNALKYTNRRMVSGANHDANSLADNISTGMIFVPSKDGISHHPDEYTEDALLVKGANVLLNYLTLL